MGTTTVANPVATFLSALLCAFHLASIFSHAANNFTTGHKIRDGDTIVSANGDLALGFFSPRNSTSRYVGVWYNQIPDHPVVWVANRDAPILDKNGVLQFGDDGSLVVLDGNGTSIWTTNSSFASNGSMAALDDTGNILLWTAQEVGDPDKAYWQSFNHPTDTYLPGMKAVLNPALGEIRPFRSWKSDGDPSPGRYYLGVDPRGAPQIVIWDGTKRWWRSGHWTGILFLGVPSMTTNLYFGFKVSQPGSDGTAYITYTPLSNSTLVRFRIRPDGSEEELRWTRGGTEWTTYQSRPANQCDHYNKCGKFGICDIAAHPICRCMTGFAPANKQQWESGNWTDGCVRKHELQCRGNNETRGGDGFAGESCMKLPDLADRVESIHTEEHCEEQCFGNCSCNAYSFVSGIGCMIWTSEELVDVQCFSGYGKQVTLNVRLDASDLGGKTKISNLMIIIITVTGTLFLAAFICLLWKYRAKLKDVYKSKPASTELSGPYDLGIEGSEINGSDLPMVSFSSVVAATDNFSEHNKLGQGGFGPVYKGKLLGGQEVAIKRLSRKSGQGLEEFKNEIIMIAKLQHRNLVRLLGCCIEPEEKILLYEYMPNKSLDYILFDPAKRPLLDWRTSFNIIEGIARGILYLHRDSRLRIIHRDLKASNVLLDENMNPKISDFGMARIFGGNQDEANTIRVVGTYGYMSPEYAMEGLFSIKSDVYSFGVLLLEIVSGRRNTSFRLSDHSNLIGYAWHLWNEGKVMDLVDPTIADACDGNEVMRCVQIGILCVQDNAANRPTMSRVVVMLESETVDMDLPRQPTMTSTRSSIASEILFESGDVISSNEKTATTTMSVGR